jgi:hypothetical protein
MSKSTIVRSVKGVSAVAAGVLLTATVGSASAAPVPATAGPVEVAAPAAATSVTAPTSSRVSAAEAGTSIAQRPSRAASARQVQAAKFAKYTKYTLNSRATKDMRGVEPSMYRGKYYRGASETKRLCIAKRESEGHYDVVSPSGSYFGAYQVSRELARGATWMMLKEHKKLMGPTAAKKVLADLRAKPMNKWPRYWQDAAFHTVMNWEHTGSGAAHWAGGRWHC